MKYQKEVEVAVTPVLEDLVDVEELLRLVEDFLDENEYNLAISDRTWNFEAVIKKYEEIGEILARMKEEV